MVVIRIVALAGIVALVPRATDDTAHVSNLRGELRAFRSGQVWLSLSVTGLGFGGMLGAFTYIAFTLTEVVVLLSCLTVEKVPFALTTGLGYTSPIWAGAGITVADRA